MTPGAASFHTGWQHAGHDRAERAYPAEFIEHGAVLGPRGEDQAPDHQLLQDLARLMGTAPDPAPPLGQELLEVTLKNCSIQLRSAGPPGQHHQRSEK